MSRVYFIDNNTNNIWKNFLDMLSGSKHPAFDVGTTDQFNSTVEYALKELGATPLFGKTLMGEKYIKGAVFEYSEDLLHFKLKFN